MSLLLLDSASLWYRAFYGMPDSWVADDGTSVNAVRGFIDMTSRLLTQYQPTRMVACLEGDWRPTWRVNLFPAYKANRVDEVGEEDEPDLLEPQIPIILDFLELLGIPMLGVDDYEADDIIATLSKRESGPTTIVTGDRDLFQLVDDHRKVKVAYLAKGLSQHDLVDLGWISQRYGIPGDRYALYAMIRGDASDGLPGIKGIGEKGAAALVEHFTSMEEIMMAARNNDPRVSSSHAKKLIADAEYAAIAPTLVHCALDVPIPKMSFQLPIGESNLEKLNAIYAFRDKYNLGAQVDRLLSALKW